MRSTFEFQVTPEQYIAALRENQQRVLRKPIVRRQFLALQVLSVLVWSGIGAASVLLSSSQNSIGAWFPAALLAGLLLIAVQQQAFQKSIFRLIASEGNNPEIAQTLTIRHDGILWTTAAGECRIAWSAVQEVRSISGGALIILNGASFIPVSDDAFVDEDEKGEFVRDLSGRLAPQAAPPQPISVAGAKMGAATGVDAKGADPDGGLSAFVKNLRTGVRLAFFLRPLPDSMQVSWTQFVALAGVGVVVPSLEALLRIGAQGDFSSYALPGAVFHLPLLIVLAWMIAKFAGRSEATLQLMVAFVALTIPLDIAYLVFFHVSGGDSSWFPRAWRYYVFYVPALWLAAAAGIGAIRLLSISRRQWLPSAVATALTIALPLTTVYHDRSLWAKSYSEESRAEYERKHNALVNESAFYLQPKLLEQELASIKPGRKGVVDLYFVGAAGYAGQDVFMKEVHSVTKLFNERFATEGRSIMLINNPESVAESPIASATSLGLALNRIGEVMDRDEDILFLFLTSHGSRDHKFSLEFWPMRFDPIDPVRLRELLDESGIKRRVIVVSACYSGGFVSALKDDNTLVIAAAAPDKNSFGCSNDADFTFFGKAYFDTALRSTYSFEEAFKIATPLIAEREGKDAYTASDPRIHVGKDIQRPLEGLARDLENRRDHNVARLASGRTVRFEKKYDEMIDLFAFRDQINEVQKQCLREMKLVSPSNLVESQPGYFGGLGPNSPYWVQLVAAYQAYADELCKSTNSEQDYRDIYRDAWRTKLSESDVESALELFKTPAGRRWVAAQKEVANDVPKRLVELRAPKIESAIKKYQLHQARIIADYQRAAEASSSKRLPH